MQGAGREGGWGTPLFDRYICAAEQGTIFWI